MNLFNGWGPHPGGVKPLLVLIRGAGETSKPSSGLLWGGGNLPCLSLGAALQGSSASCPGLNTVVIAHVTKDLLALFLCLLMFVSQRPLPVSKGSLVRLHCLLFALEISMSPQPGWCGGRDSASFSIFVLHVWMREQSRCSVGHRQGRQQSISA